MLNVCFSKHMVLDSTFHHLRILYHRQHFVLMVLVNRSFLKNSASDSITLTSVASKIIPMIFIFGIHPATIVRRLKATRMSLIGSLKKERERDKLLKKELFFLIILSYLHSSQITFCLSKEAN